MKNTCLHCKTEKEHESKTKKGETVRVWIARDGEQDGKTDRELWMFAEAPILEPKIKFGTRYLCWEGKGKYAIARGAFESVKNGTMKCFKLLEDGEG